MGAESDRTGFYPWVVLLILFLVYVSNQWSRYLLNYLYGVNPDNFDNDDDREEYALRFATGISSSQYGLLVGPAFTAIYVVAGLIAGRLSDTFNRRNVLVCGLAVWAVATGLTGLCNNFWQLLLMRIMLGVGQAFSAPPSYALIADYFPKEKRGQANGLYAFGVYVGGGLASVSLAISGQIGWRNASYVTAAYALGVLVFLALFVREPERAEKKSDTVQNEEDEESLSLMESMKIIFASNAIRWLFIAASLRFIGGYSIGGFLPTFYSDEWDDFSDEYSIINAFVVSSGGALSSWIGGYVGDKWSLTNPRARAYVPALGAILATPCMAGCLFVNNFYASMVFLFFAYLFAECWFGPAFSVLQNQLPTKVRGLAASVYIFITTLVGSVAPVVMGEIVDRYGSLEWILMGAVVFSYVGCSIAFFVLGRVLTDTSSALDDDLEEKLLESDMIGAEYDAYGDYEDDNDDQYL